MSCFEDSCELTDPGPPKFPNSLGSGDLGNEVDAERRGPPCAPINSELEELVLPARPPTTPGGGVAPEEVLPPL